MYLPNLCFQLHVLRNYRYYIASEINGLFIMTNIFEYELKKKVSWYPNYKSWKTDLRSKLKARRGSLFWNLSSLERMVAVVFFHKKIRFLSIRGRLPLLIKHRALFIVCNLLKVEKYSNRFLYKKASRKD